MKFTRKLSTLAILVSSAVQANTDGEPMQIQITASRIAQSEQATLAPVTVITRADIDKAQTSNVVDLLKGQPGIFVSNAGGMGKATSLYMRGTNNSHTLVLVDGVKLGSATLGNYGLESLALDQVERIEIVRGPRASLYGSDAIGGVIQIITRKGAARPTVSLGAGSFGTVKMAQSVGLGDDRNWLNLGLSALSTQGYDAKIGTTETDNDGYRQIAATLRAGHRFADGSELELHSMHSGAKNEFDGNPNRALVQQQVVGAKLSTSPMARWDMKFNLASSTDSTRNYKDAVYRSQIETQRTQAGWQNDLILGQHQTLTLGLDYLNDKVNSNVAYQKTERDNLGAYAQLLTRHGKNDLAFNLRSDDNQAFGRYNTGGVAWGLDVTEQLRVKASYGTAFKAPTFNDLYWPYSSGSYSYGGNTYNYDTQGNSAVRPEQSNTRELGLQYRPADQTVIGLNAYRTEVDDLISWSSTTTQTGASTYNTQWRPSNVAQARIDGIEATLRQQLGNWRIDASANGLNARDQATDNLLQRRSHANGNLVLSHSRGGSTLSARLFGEGHRYDNAANTVRLPGYATLDLYGEYAIGKQWTGGWRLNNVLDKDYVTAAGYRQAGRNVFFTVRYTPGN